MRSEIKTMLALAGLTAGCADRPAGAADGGQGKKEAPRMEQGTNGGDGVRGLPSSFGRSFATLDEYLGHLRNHAGPDRPALVPGDSPGRLRACDQLALRRTFRPTEDLHPRRADAGVRLHPLNPWQRGFDAGLGRHCRRRARPKSAAVRGRRPPRSSLSSSCPPGKGAVGYVRIEHNESPRNGLVNSAGARVKQR